MVQHGYAVEQLRLVLLLEILAQPLVEGDRNIRQRHATWLVQFFHAINNWAASYGNSAAVFRHPRVRCHDLRLHGEVQAHGVAGFPIAANGQIFSGYAFLRLSIHHN